MVFRRHQPTKNVHAPVTLAASYPVYRLLEVTLVVSRPRTLSHARMTLMYVCHTPGRFIRNKFTLNYPVGQQWLSKSYIRFCDPSRTPWAYQNRLTQFKSVILFRTGLPSILTFVIFMRTQYQFSPFVPIERSCSHSVRSRLR